jgi:hypothetical protein
MLMGNIDIYAQISDMKVIDYKNTLALVSLIEVLIEKGIIERNDVALKAQEIDNLYENYSVSNIRKS